MTQIFVAKTVEDAKLLASRSFNAPVTDIKFEVLEEPKRSLFGFMKGEARVRATYVSIDVSDKDYSKKPVVSAQAQEAAPAEEAAPVETAAPAPEASSPETAAPVEAAQEEVQEASTPGTEEVVESAEPVTAEELYAEEPAPSVIETVAVEVSPAQEVQEEQEEKSADAGVPEDADLISGEPSEAALQKIEKAKAYLAGVLAAMDVEAELKVTAGAESAMIDIEATSNGAVIGKRGETLDALQYLTFMIANRGDKEYYRIILNSAGYRERRRKTLEELAAKIARNVLRSGRQTTLEPMNPYERRIIHSTSAGIEGVTSRSVGEEPYRKVVISSTERPARRSRRSDRNDRGGRGDRRRNDRRRNNDAPPTRINMDSMKTSFEKDYKRPKPEDDLNAGLYGKIEF